MRMAVQKRNEPEAMHILAKWHYRKRRAPIGTPSKIDREDNRMAMIPTPDTASCSCSIMCFRRSVDGGSEVNLSIPISEKQAMSSLHGWPMQPDACIPRS
jgi:hypothetical protein